MLAYAGPGYLVSVGYMDPGNWATDLAGGARFGYALQRHPVVQRHGRFDAINSVSDWGCYGRDLHRHAATILVHAHPLAGFCVRLRLWRDLAELLGSAIALQLLLAFPWRGVHHGN